MTMGRFLLAAAVLISLVYLRLLLPEQTAELLDALRSMTEARQVLVHLPEGAAAWLLWN